MLFKNLLVFLGLQGPGPRNVDTPAVPKLTNNIPVLPKPIQTLPPPIVWNSTTSVELLGSTAQQCAVFQHDAEQQASTGLNTDKYMPKKWITNKYAVEVHLQDALRRSAWRVDSLIAADVVFIAANMSMWCSIGKLFAFRSVWKRMIEDEALWKGAAAGVPKFLAMQNGNCGAPWVSVRNGRRPPKFTFLVDERRHVLDRGHDVLIGSSPDVVLPYLISKPDWLVGVGKAPYPAVPWAKRKLLFFAGHIPKLYVSRTRYLIWRQVRNDKRVTTFSNTLRCTVGAYAECKQSKVRLHCAIIQTSLCHNHTVYVIFQMGLTHGGDDLNFKCLAAAQLALRNASYFMTFCYRQCRHTALQALTPRDCSMASSMSLRAAKTQYVSKCASYRKIVNYSAEMSDMVRDTRRPNANAYAREGMRHRFCLVAPGETSSTHKIGEAMAFGGAGGCIPVFVIEDKHRHRRGENILPYTRWLDYCQVGYFVSRGAATTRMGDVLKDLARVSDAEAAEKLRKLKLVRDAFVFRHGSSVHSPSATEFVIGEVCSQTLAARRGAQFESAVEMTNPSCWIADVP